jgi:hypothetical protein
MKQRLLLLSLLTVFCVKGMSQGSENIPVEGNKFYMEKGIPSSSQAVTRGDNSETWTFKSVVENCFDETKKDKEAWLMTADGETKLKVTFEYKTVDERHKIDSAQVLFLFYNGDDLFNDEDAMLITNEDITGTFTKEVTEKSVTLHMTAPKVFPDPDASWYAFYVVLGLKFKGLGQAIVARQIGVSRNGLLLMHGLNSNRQCFWPFGEYLYNTGSYLKQQYYIQDYSTSNTSSFYDNTHKNRVVENGLKTLSKKLFDIGIASTKYDMIGHSMGGILERLYIQQIDNKHTNKLITLNTPHFGSPLGEIYRAYDAARAEPAFEYVLKTPMDFYLEIGFADDSNKQAVMDLGTYSQPIQELGWTVDKLKGIRVCAVGTEIDWTASDEIRYAVSEPFYQAWGAIMLNVFNKEVKHKRVYLDENADGTDGVVSVNSQKGGCERSYIYRGLITQANHCAATEWDVIQARLLELLTSPKSGDFCLTGFGTPPANVRKRAAENFEFFTDFVEPKSTSFIKIEGKKVENQKYTHELKITHSDDMAKTVAFCVLSKDEVVYDFDKNVMHFDMSGFEGEKWIYAIGRTNYNALVIDSVKVTLGASDGIKSVEDNAELRYAIAGNNLIIKNVTDPYSIAIYNAAGQMLAEMDSNPSHTYALPRNKGLLVINVRSNKGKQFLKVLTK